MRGRRVALASASALLVLMTAAPAGAQLYRWTDAQGVVRYTNDPTTIPPAHRERATDIGSPAPRAAPPPPVEERAVAPFTAGGPINVAASIDGVRLARRPGPRRVAGHPWARRARARRRRQRQRR